MTIIWCMVPEMLSVTDQIFILYHFLSFYPPNNPKNQNWTTNENHMMYGSWDIERDRPIFLLFWTIFCLFTPPNNPKNQNFEKNKKTKTPGDSIILHKCTIKGNHMMYGSWDTKRDRQNFLSFWTVFLPFYPSNNPKD